MPGGSLQALFENRINQGDGAPRWPGRRQTMRWALNLVHAVAYMHQCEPRIVHRNLRPSNLLLAACGALKVAGFGAARILDTPDRGEGRPVNPCRPTTDGSRAPDPERLPPGSPQSPAPADGRLVPLSPLSESAALGSRATPPGNPLSASGGGGVAGGGAAAPGPPPSRYLAPELHTAWPEPEGPAGCGLEERADVFSAAVVIWAITTGQPPHAGLSDCEAAAAAADPARRLRPPTAALRPTALAALLEEAWSADPAQRPSADDLMTRLESLQAIPPDGPACAPAACRMS
jgi:serine/threonine protein kinase